MRAILPLFFMSLAGCSEVQLPGPLPYSMEPVGESFVTVEAQTIITREFHIRVLSKDGLPVPDVTVFFRVAEGTATLADSTILTDDEGIAVVIVTTGPEVQTVKVEASVPALENPTMSLYMQIVPDMPAAIRIVAGDLQEAIAQNPILEYLQVKVVDEFGNGIRNLTVNFSVTSGDGYIDTQLSQFTTDNEGIATAKYITGTQPENIITANLGSLSVDFTAFTLIPVTLTSVRASQQAANLLWTKSVNSSVSGYRIYRTKAKSSYYDEVGFISDPDITEFADMDAVIGRAYTYFVRAITEKGNFVDSNQKTGERGELIDLKNESDFADIIISNDKAALYVALRWSQRILIIDTESFQKTDSIELEFSPHALAISRDGSKLYVPIPGSPRFLVINPATKAVIQDVDLSAALGSLSVTDMYQAANGQLFAISGDDYVLRIDASDNYSASRIATNQPFSGSPTFLADHGNYLYMEESRYTPNSLFKIDMSLTDAPIIMQDEHGALQGTRNSSLSTDGSVLYLSSKQLVSTTTLKPVDVLSGTELYSLQVSNQRLFGCYYGGSFEQYKLDRLNLSTLAVEKSIVLGFKSPRLFLSADENSVFLLSEPISPYYTVRLYKVNLSN